MKKNKCFLKAAYGLTLFFVLNLLIGLGSTQIQAQEPAVVQLSGFVMTADSLMGVPYASIIIQNTGRGTISALDGYFSFAALTGDTVLFSSIGFKTAKFVVPQNLNRNKYSMIQLLTQDTVYISETFVYPWPTQEQFKQAFLTLDIPDDDLERARKNLEKERLRELGEMMAMDGNESQDYLLRLSARNFYHAGQAPPMNIFNPFAWAKFIEAWKRGDFKRKKK